MLKSLGVNIQLDPNAQTGPISSLPPDSQTGAQDTTARCWAASSSSHPTNPAPQQREGGVLFTVPVGWGQTPSLSQSLPPGDSVVSLAKPGSYTHCPPLGPTRRGRGASKYGLTAGEMSPQREFTRKRVNEHPAGRYYHIDNHQN